MLVLYQINIQTHTLVLRDFLQCCHERGKTSTRERLSFLTIIESCVDDATKRCNTSSESCQPVEERSCHLGIKNHVNDVTRTIFPEDLVLVRPSRMRTTTIKQVLRPHSYWTVFGVVHTNIRGYMWEASLPFHIQNGGSFLNFTSFMYCFYPLFVGEGAFKSVLSLFSHMWLFWCTALLMISWKTLTTRSIFS